jgi:hypothetical protein
MFWYFILKFKDSMILGSNPPQTKKECKFVIVTSY